EWANHFPPEQKLISYAVIFVLGNLLAVLAIVPMLRLQDPKTVENSNQERSSRLPTWLVIRSALSHSSFRWILLHGWWLSFAQGLTQTAFVKYSIGVLHISVEWYYVMSGTMYLLQLPLTMLAGRLSDRGWDKPVLFGSVTAV